MKIIAHRGANKKAPQNTMPAFFKAYDENADGFETDVHLTKDGIPVLCHNYTVDATSNGKGLIAELTLDEIKKLDFGRYFNYDFAETRIPTLDEFLKFVADTDVEILNLELKTPKHGEKCLVEKTLSLVEKYGLTDRLILSSFDTSLLKQAKNINPKIKTAYLFASFDKIGDQRRIPTLQDIFNAGVDYIHPVNILVTKFMVSLLHRHNIKVNVWTVNSKREIKRMKFCGVDGIITDLPKEARVDA